MKILFYVLLLVVFVLLFASVSAPVGIFKAVSSLLGAVGVIGCLLLFFRSNINTNP